MSLRRWFQEKWVDTKTGKPCGRQKGEKRKGYPACRPSRRVSSKTPKTTGEMSSSEKAKFNRTKTSSRRINYNHKRRKKITAWEHLRVGLPCHWIEPAKADTSIRLDGGIDHKKKWPKNFSTEER